MNSCLCFGPADTGSQQASPASPSQAGWVSTLLQLGCCFHSQRGSFRLGNCTQTPCFEYGATCRTHPETMQRTACCGWCTRATRTPATSTTSEASALRRRSVRARRCCDNNGHGGVAQCAHTHMDVRVRQPARCLWQATGQMSCSATPRYGCFTSTTPSSSRANGSSRLLCKT